MAALMDRDEQQGRSRYPRKRFYRARAHSNPLSDSQFPVPTSPSHIDWSEHFPAFFDSIQSSSTLKDSEEKCSVAEVSRAVVEQLAWTLPFHVKKTVEESDEEKHECSKANKDEKGHVGKESSPLAPDVEGDADCKAQRAQTEASKKIRAAQQYEEGITKPPKETGRLSPDSETFRSLKVQDHPLQQVVDRKVRFADIGCGFGGLLVSLSTLFPSTLMVGMELRDKVSEFVKERILALRRENPGHYQNISVIRTNAMKYLQNYFEKGQLQKMFFLFPDPHFKERNHRRRVISIALLAEYAHVMAVGGVLYTITDVQELGEWMKFCLDAHPLFEEVFLQEQKVDPIIKLLVNATEEGQKVQRNGGETFCSVYRRAHPPSDRA